MSDPQRWANRKMKTDIDTSTLIRRGYELLLLLLPTFGVRWIASETEIPIPLKDLVSLLTALVAGALIYWNYCRSLKKEIKRLNEGLSERADVDRALAAKRPVHYCTKVGSIMLEDKDVRFKFKCPDCGFVHEPVILNSNRKVGY